MPKIVYATIKKRRLKLTEIVAAKTVKKTIINKAIPPVMRPSARPTVKVASIKENSIKKNNTVSKKVASIKKGVSKIKVVNIKPIKTKVSSRKININIAVSKIKHQMAQLVTKKTNITPPIPPTTPYTHLADCIQGMQDFIMVKIGNDIITLFGYGDGMTNRANKGKVFKQCIRGFVNNIYAYNIKSNKWRILMKNPIKQRQGPGHVVVGEKIYFFGGYTYHPLTGKQINALLKAGITLPKKKACITYNDAYVFHKIGEKYTFTKLPNLPTSICNSGVAYNEVNNSIYIVGGSLYSSTGHVNMKNDDSIGSTVYKLDLNNPTNYVKINKLPGTPRINALCSIVNNNLYVRSGVMIWKRERKKRTALFDFYNGVMDNWKLDLSTNKWSRLKDQKYTIQNSTHIIKNNRYIYNFGGAIFPIQVSNRLSRRLKPTDIEGIQTIFMRSIRHGLESRIRLTSSIYVYDTLKDSYKVLPKGLPYYVSLPRICGTDCIYVLGGESNYFKIGNHEYFRHPNIFFKLII